MFQVRTIASPAMRTRGWQECLAKMHRSIEDAERRIDELESLVSTLRHGVNGALTPALVMADRQSSESYSRIWVMAVRKAAYRGGWKPA